MVKESNYDWKISAKKAGIAFLYGAGAGIAAVVSGGINLTEGIEIVIVGLIVGALTGGANALKNYKN